MPSISASLLRSLLLLCIGVGLLFMASRAVHAAPWHKPPAEPLTGYGSAERHITADFTEFRSGSAAAGDQIWTFVPSTLKYGERAPVVIFLHGFAALYPALYRTHIDHLVQQGNIVIFPQFQKSTLSGFLREAGLGQAADQNIWAQRAVDSVAQVLTQLGDQVQQDEIYLYGHSLGGLIALAWQANGGAPVSAIVLSHPQVNAQEGMPPFVRAFLKIIEIPWRDYAPSISAPVIILNGYEDTIAPVSQSEEILSLLQSVPSKVLYVAQRDAYGYPKISPNHGAPLDDIKGLPDHLKFFNISGELDALDYRYYFAGLDAVMDGWRDELPFDLGTWSNGRAVKPVLQFH